MKWNPDQALLQLEATLTTNAPGTALSRIVMALDQMREHKVRPTKDNLATGQGMVWCLAIGPMFEPKHFFYGQTFREAYLKARKTLLKRKRRKPSSDVSRRRRPPSV